MQATASLSLTSGAAKRRNKKANAAATAQPPSLRELVDLVLPKLRQGQIYYCSQLRVMVQGVDSAKALKRTFKDRAEWREVLGQLDREGALTYDEDRNEVVVPVPVPAAAAAATPS